ncbi:MAG: ribonuclease HII [Armatimonadota bacterium]|nr:MAG: ribonuclease HII [Armatimonadota bacterium]
MRRREAASKRKRGLWRTEQELRARGFTNIAGVDEAGRGPLAGPVVAAAVMFPGRCRMPGLADSKLLSAAERERLFELIQRRAVAIGVGLVSAETVDKLNVLRAARLAMRQAIAELETRPDLVLVDGRGVPGVPVAQRAIIGGDRLCACIAAASIVAKVARDRIMGELDEQYPDYGFGRHKGYATRDHLACLRRLGPCPVHRRTFAPVRAALQERLPLWGGSSGPP